MQRGCVVSPSNPVAGPVAGMIYGQSAIAGGVLLAMLTLASMITVVIVLKHALALYGQKNHFCADVP